MTRYESIGLFTNMSNGLNSQATGEGTHLLVPWLQRAILYDCRIKPRVCLFRMSYSKISDLPTPVEYFNHYWFEGYANGVHYSPCSFTPGRQPSVQNLSKFRDGLR